MSKFNKKVVSRVKTTNLAGGFSYIRPVKEELVFAVLSTFLEDKFYESGDERLNRVVDLVSKVPADFVAKLAIVSRKEFNLRSITTVLLGELAKTHKGDSLVMETILKATPRVDDLTELLAYVGTPVPKQVKRGIRNSLLKFDRYQLAKYKGENGEVSLVDLFNMVHPKAQHANKEQKKAWKDLMAGNLVSEDTWESEISNTKNMKKAWESLILEDKLGYMATLRNLNNLVKNGISKNAKAKVIEKLTSKEEVHKSKQLPFRFVTAYKNVTGDRELTDAISVAMDHAVDNVPKLKGKTLIAVDTSGSMSGDPIEKASIFAAALARSNDAEVVLYDTKVERITLSSRTPVIDIAQWIEKNTLGGGTNTGAIFSSISSPQAPDFDRIIIISDNESWGSNTQQAYMDYKKVKGADPYVYAIDIQGYGTTDITGRKVKHFTGWSNRFLDFIGETEKGSIVEYVENYKG